MGEAITSGVGEGRSIGRSVGESGMVSVAWAESVGTVVEKTRNANVGRIVTAGSKGKRRGEDKLHARPAVRPNSKQASEATCHARYRMDPLPDI